MGLDWDDLPEELQAELLKRPSMYAPLTPPGHCPVGFTLAEAWPLAKPNERFDNLEDAIRAAGECDE